MKLFIPFVILNCGTTLSLSTSRPGQRRFFRRMRANDCGCTIWPV